METDCNFAVFGGLAHQGRLTSEELAIQRIKGMANRIAKRTLLAIFFLSGVANGQSATPQKGIPAIARAAKNAVVTIVMQDNDKAIALGTGFLVSADGAVLTNYHVIANGNTAVVKLSDGRMLIVDGVLAADKARDLAVIKIHGKKFQTLVLGNSDKVEVGEEVVAIGHPLGLELTVSNGILSAVPTMEKEGGKFLQVTAPISHGSSGGPLFNMAGEVIGITSGINENGENLNFAVPVNDAKRLLNKQFAVMRGLPNEPEESEAAPPPAPPKLPPTTATEINDMDKRWCSEVSEKYFHYRVLDFNHVKYAFKSGYSSNVILVGILWDNPMKKCFIEIVIDYGTWKNPSTKLDSFSFSDQSYFIEDATVEGDADRAPLYGEYSNGGTEGSCNIRSPEESSMKKCRSEEEFDDLAKRYFSFVKPVAASVVLPSDTRAANRDLPPNTKMSAAGLDPAKAAWAQLFEDVRYCNQYPSDSLQEPDGQTVRCRDINTKIEAQITRCQAAPDSKTEACRNMVAGFAALKEGRQ